MIQENDKFQDFIDAKLEITKNGKSDRIGKQAMVSLYKELYPGKNITTQQMISLLRPKIDWDKEIRCRETGIKGCFYNVRYRVDIRQDDDKEETKVINNNDDNLKKKNEELEKQIRDLKKKLKEYETKPTKVNDTNEDIDYDLDYEQECKDFENRNKPKKGKTIIRKDIKGFVDIHDKKFTNKLHESNDIDDLINDIDF